MSALEEISKTLFGNSYRLELLSAVAELDRPFYARELASRLGIADNLVSTQLAKLHDAGLLERERSQADGRTVLYKRAPSSIWELASRVRSEVEARSIAGFDPFHKLPIGFDEKKPRAAARRRAFRSVEAAAAILGDEGHPLAMLTEAITDEILGRGARSGLTIERLCEKRLSHARWREHLNGEVGHVAELAARLVQAEQRRPVVCEELFSLPIRVGREMNALGVDKNPGRRRAAHELGIALSSGDRHVPVRSMPFLTGTRDDRTAERADSVRISAFEADIGQQLAATLAEHVAQLLSQSAKVRAIAEDALRSRPHELEPLGVNPDRLLEHYFPRFLIVNALPYGPPILRGSQSYGSVFPGDDVETVAALANSGRNGIARCDLGGPDERDAEFVAAVSERYGDRVIELGAAQLDAIRQWSVARVLGVDANWFTTRYWWMPRKQILIRLHMLRGEQGTATGFESEAWRWFGPPYGSNGQTVAAAVVLAEQAMQWWRRDFLIRFERDCAPGLIKSTSTTIRRPLIALTLAAWAAVVATDRALQAEAHVRESDLIVDELAPVDRG